MNSYTFGTADEDMLLLINMISILNKGKLEKMVKYKNDKGNNVLHIASSSHFDKCIRYIVINFSKLNLISEKNNDGDTPSSLYQKGSIEVLLHQEIKLF
jgi:hypothetical protein